MTSIISSQPKLFIGIDVHKKSWSVHIRTDISEHKTYTMAPIASALGDYVNRLFSDYEVHVCYEASCCGFTAARYFLSLGWKVTSCQSCGHSHDGQTQLSKNRQHRLPQPL